MGKGDGRGDTDYFRAEAIKKAIQECISFDLSEKESLVYISNKLPFLRRAAKGSKPKKLREHVISVTTFYKFKKQAVAEMDDVDKRMHNHAKIGFVKKHFEIMDDTETIVRNLRSLLFTTTNPQAKATLGMTVLQYENFLYQLNLSSPIIDQMKHYVDEKLKDDSTYTPPEESNNDTDSGPIDPSACVLPAGLIKSGYVNTDDGGGISTGKQSANRVFKKTREPPPKTLLDS